jgi:GcrA cell cycle regulator
MSWTDERVSLLRKLWGEGKTAAEIAGVLGGVTRNAVIGKAHRLKLSNRISPIQQNIKAAPRPSNEDKPVVTRIAKPAEIAAKKTPFKIRGVKMQDLKEKMCRWPSGDPKEADFVFCGHDHLPGLPYCPEHAKQAYQVARNGPKPVQVPNTDNYGTAAEAEEKEAANG